MKRGGFSRGYTVDRSQGPEWSAKFPPEASTEVVASRLLWGIGYHQPPIYYLAEWKADKATSPNPQLPARFRESTPDLHGLETGGTWSYYENPFVGTRELNGLLTLQVMLGNSDLKDDAERALHAQGAGRRGAALVRRARPRADVRPHRRARRAARRSRRLREDRLHHRRRERRRPLRLPRPAQGAVRQDHAGRRPLDLPAARRRSPTRSGRTRFAPAATREPRPIGSSAGSSRRSPRALS